MKTSECPYASFQIVDGILIFTYNEGIIINFEVAQNVVRHRLQYQKDHSYPILCDTRGVIDTDKAARDFLAREGSLLTNAVAFLVDSPLSSSITGFYLQTTQLAFPTTIYKTKYEAIHFLNTVPKI